MIKATTTRYSQQQLQYMIIVMVWMMLNVASRISALQKITFSYNLDSNYNQCSDGLNSLYLCPSIPSAMDHLYQSLNATYFNETTTLTIILRVQSVSQCAPPNLFENDNLSYIIVLENSLNPNGLIGCEDYTTSILPDSPSIASFEARNIIFTNAKIQLSHSPNVIMENCIFNSASSLIFGEFTDEKRTDPRKSTSFYMKNISHMIPNLIMISQYDTIFLTGFKFDRIYYPYNECLFTNSRSLVWEDSDIRFILYIELIDEIVFHNTVTLDNSFISITQARNIAMDNVGSDRENSLIPYPLFHISFSVYVRIKNCSLKIDSPFLYTSSLMGISLDSLTFHESISDTLIMAISVKSLQVKNCYFYNISANCLKIGDIFDFEISNSIFSNIVSNLGAINYNDASSSSLKPFSGSQYHAILNTTFENCKGGALNFLTNNKVSIRNCNFYYNNAPEGSAILFKQDQTKSFLDVKNSKFIGNGSPTTYGGVAFIVGGASFTASIFENNVAERGGVVYVGEGAKFAIVAFLDSCEFINNSALLGNIGYTESPNPKSIFKNSNRSDTLFENEDVSSPCFKFDFQVFDAISGEKMDEKKMISPYLGQTLVIVIDPLDVYGKKIKGPNGLLSISTDNSKYLLRTGKASESGIRMEFTIFSHEKLESFEKFTLSLKFQRANSKIQVIVTDCPSLYIFDAAGCVNIWYWIPIASVLSSFIAGISLIAVIFICFARYKSQLLKRRKQADKEMEQVLLDKRIIFENDESPRTPKTFIISTDDIKIIKKIGEGGQGTVYQAKWNNKEVAIKSIKKDGIDDDDEFEKEATLLMSLSHPNIGK